MSAHRAAARLARRELRRRPWRTFLVVALIAIPIAIMVVGTTYVRTSIAPRNPEFGDASLQITITHNVDSFPGVDSSDSSFESDHHVEQAVQARIKAIESAEPKARIVELSSSRGGVKSATGDMNMLNVTAAPFANPLAASLYKVKSGRLPTEPAEVALSASAAQIFEVDEGANLDIGELDLHGRVVGIVGESSTGPQLLTAQIPDLDPRQIEHDILVAMPTDTTDAALLAIVQSDAQTRVRLNQPYADSLRRTNPKVVALANQRCCFSSSGTTSYEDKATTDVMWGLVGEVIAFAVLGLVISVAFALGARRQLQVLGLAAANGASPSFVRAIVLWQGAWAGVIGSFAGVVLGFAGLVGFWRWGEARFRGFTITRDWWQMNALDWLPIVAIGIVASLASSYYPARSASQVSVLQMLAGRRPMRPVHPRLAAHGVMLAAAGLGLIAIATVGTQAAIPEQQTMWTLFAIVGGLAILGGVCAAGQIVVGTIAAMGGRVGGAPRLALRGLGRQRTRYGSVVAGICASAALALAAGTVLTTESANESAIPRGYLADNTVVLTSMHEGFRFDESTGRPLPPTPPSSADIDRVIAITGEPQTQAELRAISIYVQGGSRRDIAGSAVGTTVGSSGYSTVGAASSGEWDRALELTEAERNALREIGAIALGVEDVTKLHTFDQGAPSKPLNVAIFPQHVVPNGLPNVLIEPRVLSERNIAIPEPSSIFLFAPYALTAQQLNELRQLSHPSTSTFRLRSSQAPAPLRALNLSLPSQRAPTPVVLLQAAVTAIALLFSGFVIAIGLALAAADSRDERDVLDVLGTPPKTQRRIAGIKAATLAFVGAIVALPAGILPVVVAYHYTKGARPTAIPWPTVLMLTVIVPALIGMFAYCGSAIASHFRHVTASRFSFD